MNQIFKCTFLLFFLVLVSACASGAKPEAMIAHPDDASIINKSGKYYKSLSVNPTSGG